MSIRNIDPVNLEVHNSIPRLSQSDVDFLTKFPVKFIEGNFADYMWGGFHLYDMKGLPCGKNARIAAESWEISGHQKYPSRILMPDKRIFTFMDLLKDKRLSRMILGDRVVECFGQDFPMLVKFVDVHQHMSVHLHPSREIAKALGEKDPGKEEVFIVLDLHEGAEKKSLLYLGLKEEVTRQALLLAIEKEENILDLLHKVYVKQGEIYRIPSGALHCWGGGSIAIEIAESSDLTYRMYDFNRQRPMHVKKGLVAINHRCKQGAMLEKQCRGSWQPTTEKGIDAIVTQNALRVERLSVSSEAEPVLVKSRGNFEVLMGIEGAIEVILLRDNSSVRLNKVSSLLIPSKAGDYLARGIGAGKNNRALRISMKV